MMNKGLILIGENMKTFEFRVRYNDKVYNRGGAIVVMKGVRKPKIGVAVCSPLDNFSKKRGYEIAVGRLKSRPLTLHRTGCAELELRRLVWVVVSKKWETIINRNMEKYKKIPSIILSYEPTGLGPKAGERE